MQAIPKIYDKENEQWIELMAKPIAEEVIKLMKEDYLKYKGQIEFWDIVNDEGTAVLPLFLDKEKLDKVAKLNGLKNAEDLKNNVVPEIQKDFTGFMKDKFVGNNALIEYINSSSFEDLIKVLPPALTIYLETSFGEYRLNSSYKVPLMLSNKTGIAVFDNKFKVSYIFNDHPIDDLCYMSDEYKQANL